jgi:hypothetical protein
MKTAGHKMKVQQISIMSSMSNIFQTMYNIQWGDRGSTVVKALCYKSEGHWFDPRWCQWTFH